MRDQHMMTSRLDSRFAGYQLDAGATNTSFDYSNANIEDCFLTAFRPTSQRTQLPERQYLLRRGQRSAMVGRVQHSGESGRRVSRRIRTCILFVGMGYYDFACPFYPNGVDLAHLKVSDEIKKNNISTGYYEAGHMVYIDQPSAAKYHADLVKFVQASLPK